MIDFSTFPDSDGKPMAENEDNALQALIAELEARLRSAGQGESGRSDTVG